MNPLRCLAVAVLLGSLSAAGGDGASVSFTDITMQAGIRFKHNSGRSGEKYLPETLGSGCAIFDADGDGWPDLFLVNGRNWNPKRKRTPGALYLNNHNGTFTDITAGSGLDVDAYGMGITAADYDNDGREDVYLTALEGDRLFHNEGSGKYRDVTASSGIRNAGFGTSAAWLDYDRDGRLDLFVANYVEWSRDKDLWCTLDGATKSYCTPESYRGSSSRLYRNLGGGRFADTTERAGILDPTGKSLGVAVLDFDGDGWPDIFVSNDTQPNKLYRNGRNGSFTEVGMISGVAYSEDGVARGAMGTDWADYDRSGRPHLLVGNFSNQMLGLYHNEGNGLFVDDAPSSSIGRASLLSLTFGAFFLDYDLDGYPDIFAANGHIEEEINRIQRKVYYRQPPLMFRNLGEGGFEDVSAALGRDFSRPVVARGASKGDIDGDGDLDILMTTNDGPPYLLRNDGGNRNNWLRIRTVGTTSNHDGIGTVVRIRSASGKQWDTVRTGSSYCSQSEKVLTFGLGRDRAVDSLELAWPSGVVQRFSNVPANQLITVEEDGGIVAASKATAGSP